MGRDAAAGSEAVSQAGGTVLLQSPESAEHAMMPSAVVETGVADMVLPLPELGRVIAGVVAGDALPRTLSERAAAESCSPAPAKYPPCSARRTGPGRRSGPSDSGQARCGP